MPLAWSRGLTCSSLCLRHRNKITCFPSSRLTILEALLIFRCNFFQLGRWLQEFHLTAAKSYTGSLEYLKTLSNVALSSVLYNRGIFPKKSYSLERYKGQIIPMLKQKSDCHEANIFHSWITGFQDAIDKKYVSFVCFTVYCC